MLTMTGTKLVDLLLLILVFTILTESSAVATACRMSSSENRIVFIGDSISAGEFGATTYIDSRDIKSVSNYSISFLSFKACQEGGGKSLTPDSGDRIHPGGKQAAYWARCAASAVAETLKRGNPPQGPGAKGILPSTSGVAQ